AAHSVAYYSINEKIYVSGGYDSSNTQQDQVWEFNPLTNTWDTSRQNIPVGMAGSATSIVGHYIYLMGSPGLGGVATTLHYRYDILGNIWVARALLHAPTAYGAAGAVGDTIALFGGVAEFTTFQPYNTTYLYD